VIKDAPPADALPRDTPPSMRRLLDRCLERDPRLRLRDIGEARIVLSAARDDGEESAAAPASRRLPMLLAAAGIALAAVVGILVWRARPQPDLPVRRFELPAAIAAASQVALAPDGSRIAYLSEGHLWVRALDALEPKDLGPAPVTTFGLFWSPDSRTIAFEADGTLRSMPAAGGTAFTICKLPPTGQTTGAAWRTDGTIVFAAWRDNLYIVPASGGKPEIFAKIDPAAEIDFHSVSPLPDDRLVVTTHLRPNDPSYRIEIVERGGRRKVLISDPSVDAVQYVSGHLLFHRLGANEGVWAVPYAEGPIDLGPSRLVAAGARVFGAAADGTLFVRWFASKAKSSLVWIDRKGVAPPPIGGAPFERVSGAALSPNGRRAAFFAASERGPYLVVRDLQTGVDTRLTFREGDAANQLRVGMTPAWLPTGDRVLYSTGGIEAGKLVAQNADGASDARELTAGVFGRVSSDASRLVSLIDDRGARRLRYAPIAPDGSVGAVQRVFEGGEEPNVNGFDLSPDGTLLAYAVTGADRQSNIFLTRFPGGSGRWQVTSEGGTHPRFGHDGRELFYTTGTRDNRGRPTGKLMVVPVTSQPTVSLGAAATVIEESSNATAGITLSGYDVAPDGRILVTRTDSATAESQPRLVVVQNWLRAIRE